ncbi:DNA polymerase IV [Nocardioides litoris]|uniref:DNA polymerase IV n=1 Tax=Nocardioides litoris TaxID=1926648 RepID=UPI001FED0129|nr:DNA polymerase IV [Nocardioides litoris]
MTTDAAGCRTPVLHVDMDAFYASVLLRDRPDLQDRPVIVGGGHRGVVLAANYPARAFGVRSAMSGPQARRLCPQAVSLAPDYPLFSAVSRSVMALFRQVTPRVEAVSLDEAFLDLREAGPGWGSPVEVAETLRAAVHDEQRITCSVGIAASVSVAKLASRRAKPDGVTVLAPEDLPAEVHPLDVGVLYGVGEKTRARLHRLGLVTVGDVARQSVPDLQRLLGRHLGLHLHHLAWGTDRREVTPGGAGVFGAGEGEPDRSMGAQETFGRDTADREEVLRELLRLTAKVCARLRAKGVVGRTVALTVRFTDFTTVNRSRTLAEATDVTQEVYAAAAALYDVLQARPRRVRLVGVRIEGLVDRERVQRQGVLGERDHGWSEADRAVDQAVGRFGAAAVRPASLLGPGVGRRGA